MIPSLMRLEDHYHENRTKNRTKKEKVLQKGREILKEPPVVEAYLKNRQLVRNISEKQTSKACKHDLKL